MYEFRSYVRMNCKQKISFLVCRVDAFMMADHIGRLSFMVSVVSSTSKSSAVSLSITWKKITFYLEFWQIVETAI